MRQPFIDAFRRIFRTEFAPEWLSVAALAALAVLWMVRVGFELTLSWRDGEFLFAAFAIVLVARCFKFDRLNMTADYFALSLAATMTFGLVSYLAMATPGPLFDDEFLAADRALGFDWLTGFHWLEAHPAASKIFEYSYDSLVYQGLYFGILFGLMGKRRQLREMYWLVFIAGLFTSAGAVLFPAFGAYKAFGLESYGTFLPDMERLRSGHHLSFALSKLSGVVSFPSFHTTMALTFMYGFRRTGLIGWLFIPVNIAMLAAIPYFGGHYLVDMIAGAAVMLVSLACVKVWPMAHYSIAPSQMRKSALAN
jgi:hypothetical protein